MGSAKPYKWPHMRFYAQRGSSASRDRPGHFRHQRGTGRSLESELAARGLPVFPSDTVADYWHHRIRGKQIIALAMRRLEVSGKGFTPSRHPSGNRRRHAGSTQALKNKGFHNHLVRDEGIAGSNPATPTTQRSFLRAIPRHEARRSAVLKRCFILQLSFILNPIITASLAD